MNRMVSAKVAEIYALTGQAQAEPARAQYEHLALAMGELTSLTREAMQTQLSTDYHAIVQKLESDGPLSGEDIQLLRQIIVGDAKYYTEHDQNFAEWLQELEHLTTRIAEVDADSSDQIETLMQLHALSRDASGVLSAIVRYLTNKERVVTFETTIRGGLTPAGRQLLADVIKAMISSKTM